MLPILLSPSVSAERRQLEGYGSYLLLYSDIEDEALARERARYEVSKARDLNPKDERARQHYERLKG